MGKTSGFVQLMRPVNCAMMGFAVFVGAVLADPQFFNAGYIAIIYGFITGFMLTAASMTINDYYDRVIDAINEPSRPIPSGIISAQQALTFVFILSLVGFIFAYFTSVLCLLVAIISWVVVVTYVTVGKRSGLPGNFLVSICVAIPFIYGSIAVLNSVPLSVVLFTSMAFLSNTGREITKDKAEGIKTLAVHYGEKSAAVTAAVFYVSAVMLTPFPPFLNLVSFWFIPLVLVTDIGLVLSSALLLKDYSRENARKIKKWVLLLFVVGLLAYVMGFVR